MNTELEEKELDLNKVFNITVKRAPINYVGPPDVKKKTPKKTLISVEDKLKAKKDAAKRNALRLAYYAELRKLKN